MSEIILELVTALRSALVDKLTLTGELQPGETISIKASIFPSKGKVRKTLTIDKGIGTFALSGYTFYDRQLTSAEIEKVQTVPLPDRWQQAVVSHLLQGKNEPVNEENIRDIAKENGYGSRKGMYGKKTTLYGSTVVSRINHSLKASNQVFRIMQSEKKGTGTHWHNGSYRLYRMVGKDPKDSSEANTE